MARPIGKKNRRAAKRHADSSKSKLYKVALGRTTAEAERGQAHKQQHQAGWFGHG